MKKELIKINGINGAEILNDKQLDNISGGTINETSADSQILAKNFNATSFTYNKVETLFNWDNASTTVDKGWAKLGIRCITKPFSKNEYYYGTQKLNRGEAILLVEKMIEARNNNAQ